MNFWYRPLYFITKIKACKIFLFKGKLATEDYNFCYSRCTWDHTLTLNMHLHPHTIVLKSIQKVIRCYETKNAESFTYSAFPKVSEKYSVNYRPLGLMPNLCFVWIAVWKKSTWDIIFLLNTRKRKKKEEKKIWCQ